MKTAPLPKSTAGRARSDAELLRALAEGDPTALGILYDRHARDVWRVLDRVTNGGSDVEDILHATFLGLPKLAANFDGRSPSCRNWLCGVATRLALRHGRSVRRFAAMLTRFRTSSSASCPIDPERQVSDRQEVAALERAVAALSPKKRAVFVLVEREGLSHAEVAEALSIPLATVRTRLFGAKNELRAVLRLPGVEEGEA